jgi:Xaa-Pro aminopeptidase
MYPLTIEERDRRWRVVREAMERRKLDCLVVYGATGAYRHLAANLRYLSNVAVEGYVVFPLQGDPTLISFWAWPNLPWVKDSRGGKPNFSQVISQRLKELHIESGRIGLVALSGYDGELGFPYKAYISLTDYLPKVLFEDATDIVLDARMIKSTAEIECFEIGCEVGEKVIQAIVETAKPGVRDTEVRLKMMETLYREGCEPGSMILYHSGKEIFHGGQGGPYQLAGPKMLEGGDIILLEFDASYFGYLAQYNQPFSIGEPDREWREICNVAKEAFNNGIKVLKPGITAGELDQTMLSPIKEAGYTCSFPAFHGLGLSLEEPMASFPAQATHKPETSLIMRPSMVLELEPDVAIADTRSLQPFGKKGVTLGCPVMVTEEGCKLLSKTWKPELRVIK